MIIAPIVPRHRINGPCWKRQVYTVEIFVEDYLRLPFHQLLLMDPQS